MACQEKAAQGKRSCFLIGQQKTCKAKDGFPELQSSDLQEDPSENDPERWTENEVRIRVLRASPTFSAHSTAKFLK